MRRRHCLLLASALCTASAVAQDAPRPLEPRYTRVFGSDSMAISAAALSPDGRWIVVANQESATRSNLWLVPARGGNPMRLTDGDFNDQQPSWLPSGDRIVFSSNRVSRPNQLQNILLLQLDPATGAARGAPRQITLESNAQYPLVTPDGRTVVYQRCCGVPRHIMAVPVSGGAATEIAVLEGLLFQPQLSASGRYLYAEFRPRGATYSKVMRVRLDNGAVEDVSTNYDLGARRFVAISPDERQLLMRVEQSVRNTWIEATTFDHRVLARFTPPRNFQVQQFLSDGRLLGITTDMVAPVRVLPLAGGPGRQLTNAVSHDSPVGWTRNGTHIVVSTQINGHDGLLEFPLAGGPATEIRVPADALSPLLVSRSGNVLAYRVRSQDERESVLVARDNGGNGTRTLTRSVHMEGTWKTRTPGGGVPALTDGFVFAADAGDQIELRSWNDGRNQLVRAFPKAIADHSAFGVFGDRVAYTVPHGDSTSIYVASGRTGTPTRVATVAGFKHIGVLVWSVDGRWLAAEYYAPPGGERVHALIIGFDAAGNVTAAARTVDTGVYGYGGFQWLPDNSALLMLGMNQNWSTDIILVPLRPGARSEVLTRDDPNSIAGNMWDFLLSPDGRYVAYASERARGSSIWLLDLTANPPRPAR